MSVQLVACLQLCTEGYKLNTEWWPSDAQTVQITHPMLYWFRWIAAKGFEGWWADKKLVGYLKLCLTSQFTISSSTGEVVMNAGCRDAVRQAMFHSHQHSMSELSSLGCQGWRHGRQVPGPVKKLIKHDRLEIGCCNKSEDVWNDLMNMQ